ncbi:DUF4007 family protein [Jeongeupia sp. USM3]|uniref:DUF4007 family protein n=1 Tax=Jeongeupia sp. USM3 TaxID=1906741 RepID=UPI00089E0708|nr:DUF4007 family protein [Jeongeupia sp. USM3]AOY00920.1 hypothetical protein BJP62_10995 [Jeongeupia sp. USM3]
MSTQHERAERFSGHESFICRYGWLPKLYNAVLADARVLKEDEKATQVLGIGRNMVRSILFWGESMGVVGAGEQGGLEPGPLGRLLLGPEGLDPYLENQESLWLLHWWLCTRGNLAAWGLVFGSNALSRFDKQLLVERLKERGQFLSRSLVLSTLEVHANILCQTYYQDEKSGDDTSWSPLQNLGLLQTVRDDSTRTQFVVAQHPPVGLSARAFAFALVDFLSRQAGEGTRSVSMQACLNGQFSPGTVFRLDELQLRLFLDEAAQHTLTGALRFIDTADTQTIILDLNRVPTAYLFPQKQRAEVSAHV